MFNKFQDFRGIWLGLRSRQPALLVREDREPLDDLDSASSAASDSDVLIFTTFPWNSWEIRGFLASVIRSLGRYQAPPHSTWVASTVTLLAIRVRRGTVFGPEMWTVRNIF